ncbi:microsomal glutathione S-transferase 3-like isoform X2 [Portunus trituberculatus]|nr:microsomal glutathione S-transferase 3-like isoform X2 [Portunus trituberculatus]XP_045114683.1 microsomal glutathione S-transferase 3-like isoform X2 [Portunus trituberculatus]
MVVIEVQPEYGYCVLVAVGSSFMLIWKAMKVGHLRKKLQIKYPTMYSNDNQLFNCYQRAHQNTLENYPTFLMLLLLGGLQHPVVCAVGGTVWCLGRIAFATGYYTGDPSKRTRGTFAYLGLIAMLYSTGRLATRLLGWY